MENENKSFFGELWERRVFQIVGSYLIGAWAFVQFTDWVVERYGLASGWTEFVIIFLLAVLPSVVMLTWYHGKPGPDAWRNIEKIFIPVNVLAAGVIAFLAFPTEGKAEQMQTVVATSEEGDTIVRNIPTMAFQERIAVFPSKNDLRDTNSWIVEGLPILLNKKLEQDMRFTTISGTRLTNDIADYGFKEGGQIPMNIYRTVAEDVYTNHYVLTELKEVDDQLEVQYSIHESKTGNEKKSGTFTGDLFAISDFLHDEVRSTIFLSDFVGTDDYVNLNSGQLISPQLAALKAYVKGLVLMSKNKGSEEGLAYLLQSTEIDPTCSECYASTGEFGMSLRGIGFKKERIQKAFEHYKALPERQQLNIKYWKYFPEDSRKIQSLCDMWMKLYPMDAKPYQRSMDFLRLQMQVDKATEIGKRAVQNGHGGNMYLKLAELYTLQGDVQKSNEYIKIFAEDHPQKAKTVSQVGLAYLFDGEHEKGIDFFESKVLLDSDKPKNHIELATAYSMKGDLEKVLSSYDDALAVSKDARDSINTFQVMELTYGGLGRMNKFFKIFEKRKKLIRKVSAPLSSDFNDIFPYIVNFYKQVNRADEVKKRMKTFIKTYSSPAYDFKCAAHINYFVGTQNGDSLVHYMDLCRDYVLNTDGGDILLLADGVAFLGQGKYDLAIEKLEGYSKGTGLPLFQLANYIGRAYFLKGDLKKAEEIFEKSLTFSSLNPTIMFYMAQVHDAKGNRKKALQLAEKALKYWENADVEYIPKQELKKFIATL